MNSKLCVIELAGNDAFTDSPDGPPRYPGEHGDAGLVRPGDKPGDHILKVRSETGPWSGEWDTVNHNPVGWAAQPPTQHRQHGWFVKK